MALNPVMRDALCHRFANESDIVRHEMTISVRDEFNEEVSLIGIHTHTHTHKKRIRQISPNRIREIDGGGALAASRRRKRTARIRSSPSLKDLYSGIMETAKS